MKTNHFVRSVVLAGLVGAATLVAVMAPSAAQANVRTPPIGSEPGNLTLNPSSGPSTVTPSFSTSTPCPSGQRTSAMVVVAANSGINENLLFAALPGSLLASPFSGTLSVSMADALSVAGPAGQTYEFAVACRAGTTNNYVQSTFVTYDATGANWTSSPTPPGPGPTATTTNLTSNYTTAPFGTSTTFTAVVTPAGATGNVEFSENGTVFATVALSSGSASTSTSSLQVGDHPIQAHYVGSATHSPSTSSTLTIHITPAGSSGSETINVNVPLSEGVFTLTVTGTPVMTDAVNDGTNFTSTGTLGAVTVNDGRQQTRPGWSVSGQVSDFTSGPNSFSGTSLGWSPTVTVQNPAGDVVAGPAVPAGSNPGLKGGSELAHAAATHGLFQSVLGAGLTLQFPNSTPQGSYSALLTLTAVTHA